MLQSNIGKPLEINAYQSKISVQRDKRRPVADGGNSGVGETRHQRLADCRQNRRWSSPASAVEKGPHPGGRVGRLGNLERGRGLRERDRDRALWGARSAEDVREALQKEWR